MNEVCEEDIPTKQDSYSTSDLKQILTGYKRISGYKHYHFSLKELKKYLKKYKKSLLNKKSIYTCFDNDDFKWEWSQKRTTIEELLI